MTVEVSRYLFLIFIFGGSSALTAILVRKANTKSLSKRLAVTVIVLGNFAIFAVGILGANLYARHVWGAEVDPDIKFWLIVLPLLAVGIFVKAHEAFTEMECHEIENP